MLNKTLLIQFSDFLIKTLLLYRSGNCMIVSKMLFVKSFLYLHDIDLGLFVCSKIDLIKNCVFIEAMIS